MLEVLCLTPFLFYLYDTFAASGSAPGLLRTVFMSLACSVAAFAGLMLTRPLRWRLHQSSLRGRLENDSRGYFLLLRSFHLMRLRRFTYQHAVDSESLTDITIDHFERLEWILRGIGPAVALGQRDAQSLLSFDNVLRLPDEIWNDHDWFEVMSRLAEGSQAIFVMPEVSNGIIRELHFLQQSGLHARTLIYMPPIDNVPEHFLGHSFYEGEGSFARHWEDMRSLLRRQAGFELPPYEPRGCLYVPDSRFAPMYQIVLSEKVSARDIERVMTRIRTLSPRTRPAAELLPLIRELDHIAVSPSSRVKELE